MQHTSDKDFDSFFRNQLLDAEVTPSGDLWANISQQIQPKAKRSFPVMWLAAASVAVIAAVMLFAQSDDKIYLQGTSAKVVAKEPTAKQSVSNASNLTGAIISTTENKPTQHIRTTELLNVSPTVEPKQIAPEKNIYVAMQPTAQDEHLPVKRAEAIPLDITPVEVDKVNENTTVYLANNGADYDYEAAETTNKKGIRNMGDLINYVVDKVDKRENKLVKFDTDDDDNSTIVGINIGFLKLNRKK